MVQDLGCRVRGLGLGCRVLGLGSRVELKSPARRLKKQAPSNQYSQNSVVISCKLGDIYCERVGVGWVYSEKWGQNGIFFGLWTKSKLARMLSGFSKLRAPFGYRLHYGT